MSRNEVGVERLLIDACKEYKIYQHKGNSSHLRGFPDRVIYNQYTKKILHVEVKYGSSYKQTKMQKRFQRIIEEAGGNYFLITGVQEMREFIDKHIKVEVKECQDTE